MGHWYKFEDCDKLPMEHLGKYKVRAKKVGWEKSVFGGDREYFYAEASYFYGTFAVRQKISRYFDEERFNEFYYEGAAVAL